MATLTVPQKWENLEAVLNSELQERVKEVHTACLALTSGTHHFTIGPPGTAKSLLVRRIAQRISGLEYMRTDDRGIEHNEPGYFQWLLTRYSVPEELFGPPMLDALERGEYTRNVSHKLPTARLCFLDEIMKANSSILNALLTILNERLFFNNGDDIYVPLSTVFAASNEMPQGDELHALWDRLHFRHEVKPIQDGGSFITMLSTPMEKDPEAVLTWSEIVEAQHAAEQVQLPSDIYEALKMLRDALRTEGVEPTERRFVESLKIIRAEAYLNGREIAEVDDMRPLRHVLWTDLPQQRIVEKEVLNLANPTDKEARDLLERVEGLHTELKRAIKEADNPKMLAKQCVEIHGKLKKVKSRMDELQERVDESGRQSEELEDLKKHVRETAKVLMNEGFNVPGETNL